MSEANRFSKLLASLFKSSDPDKPFFYLGGPMANMEKFNYPKFYEVAEILRCNGYKIISPAEVPDQDVIERAEASLDGSYEVMQRTWKDFMEDTITIISMPNCKGAIFLPEWKDSKGCMIEAQVMQAIGKPVYEFGYSDKALGCPCLTLLPPNWYNTTNSPKLSLVSSPGAVEVSCATTMKSKEADRAYNRRIR